METPLHYLDFETFSPAIPRFAGTRTYDAIPFLFSVHVERDGQPTEHIDYLHDGSDDPRPRIAERLIDALGQEGSICVYSPYEGRVLQDLIDALPEHEAALEKIKARLFDLLPVVRSSYYHPEFRGSFSIKSVLPAMVPGAGYENLAIADGQTAAAHYALALKSTEAAEREQTFEALRAYCKQDTLAMVELRRALASVEQTAR